MDDHHLSIENSRSVLIDFIRGTAIILVVFGHNIQFGSGMNYYLSDAYFENIIFKVIYSFHMPLFSLISGYLFYSRKKVGGGVWNQSFG